MKKEYLEIGKAVAVSGLAGELRVQYYCDSADVICGQKRLFAGREKTEYAVTRARSQKNIVVLKLKGIDDIDTARSFVGRMLYIRREDMRLPEGSYFIQDLIGMTVRDADSGEVYGKIDDVYQNGAADVYSIKTGDGRQLMFPAIPQVLLSVDTEKEEMVIRPLEGLFDI